MTDQEQRIAIAEACGWKGQLYRVVGVAPDYKELACPDYLHNLNAIQEAVENSLTGDQKQEFAWAVYRLLEPGRLIVNATAAQRAEAFLRTIGKWKE